jgi:predicted glutamine amidotransferase
MCQIIVITNNKKIDKEFLNSQYSQNRDGIGFCYYQNNKWYWKKFSNFDEFYNFYSNCDYQKAIIHFRFGTYGSKNINNTHPFLVSQKRDIDLSEGVLDDDEVLIMENGNTSEIFDVAKFVLGEDLKQKDFSDTKTIAYVFKKLNIFDAKEIAKRLSLIDNSSRFVVITNKKVYLLGNFIKYKKNVYLSSGICRYAYIYGYSNKKRLSIAGDVERAISEKLNVEYIKTNLYYNFDTKLFELEINNKKTIFGFKGLKKFLRKIGIESNKVEEFIKKLKEDVEREKKEKKSKKSLWYDDYVEYENYRWWDRYY